MVTPLIGFTRSRTKYFFPYSPAVSSVSPIYVDFEVAEQDYLRFRKEKDKREQQSDDRKLALILNDGSVFPHSGRVLSAKREAAAGTMQVRGEFPNPGNVLRPGQSARVRVVTELRKGALLIPQRALTESQGVYQVGVVSPDHKATIKTVKAGALYGDMRIVDSGLEPGEDVIIDGLQRIRDGMTVAATPFKDTQASGAAAVN